MSTTANEEDNCTITYFYTPNSFNSKVNSHMNINKLHLLVNIGLLSLTSVITTNNSEVTVNVPSVALMRRMISLVFSRSNFPMTVIFPDEAPMENFAACSLGNKE